MNLTYTYIDILISSVLALIMFGIGLSLYIEDFKRVLTNPGALITGLIVQMIILPSLGFLIACNVNVSPEIKVGIMILSLCPGGTTSGFITYFFKGNVALSISLTTINSLLTLISIPIAVNFSLEYFMGINNIIKLPVFESILQIFIITIIPASLGIWVKIKNKHLAHRFESPVKYSMITLLAIVFIIKIFAGKAKGGTDLSLFDIKTIILPALFINLFGIFLGHFISRLLKFSRKNSFTIGTEAGLHNTTLAFLVAGTLLHNEEMVKPSLIYAMFSFWLTAIYGLHYMIIRPKILRKKQ